MQCSGRKAVIEMMTNLRVETSLVTKAVRLGRHKSKREAVTQALIEYVARLEQQEILSLFGTVDYDPKYDYKRQRRRA